MLCFVCSVHIYFIHIIQSSGVHAAAGQYDFPRDNETDTYSNHIQEMLVTNHTKQIPI